MSKFGNVKTVIDGIKFDSKKEANYYNLLKLLKKSGRIEDFKIHPRFNYLINYTANGRTYTKKAYYEADFEVIYKDRTEIVDVKGVQTAIFKQKKRIIKELYGIEIVLK